MTRQQPSRPANIIKVETGFSENSNLSNRTFSSVLDADVAVMQAVACYDAGDRFYDKTDFTVTWSDGETYSDRLDANRTNNFSTHFAQIIHFYQGSRPDWMTLEEWINSRAQWVQFSKNRVF